MTKILLSTFVLFFALTASATKPIKVNYLTDKYMKMINLQDLQILNKNTNDSEFGYSVEEAETVSKAVQKALLAETASQPVSRFYELAEESSFQNIYVYIGRNPDDTSKNKYVLNIVYVNSNDSLFGVDYEITKANPKTLSLENGASHGIEKLEASIKNGTFFPY